MGIISFIVVGLIAGALARLVISGTGGMSILATIGIGMGGSLIGGTLGSLISGEGFEIGPAGIIGAFIGAVILLLVLRRVGSNDSGGRRARR